MTDNNKTVLLVEDEHDLRVLYEEMLIEAGYTVLSAPDGEVGMDMIKSKDWNVLLLDIMLPGKDGLKILKEIRDHPEYKKGKIVSLTNLNSDQIIKECMTYGADGYLIKSEITPDSIVKEVDSFLQNKQ